MGIVTIVMAGGRGTRMQSSIPKVLHHVNGIPMIVRVVDACIGKTIVVVNPETGDSIRKALEGKDVTFVIQSTSLGTADAIRSANREYLDTDLVFILNGDMPLIDRNDLFSMLQTDGNKIGVTVLQNPTGYGRMIMNADQVFAIREEKDCTEREKGIRIVNAGIYFFRGADLRNYLPKIRASDVTQEYYLTSIVELMVADGMRISTCIMDPLHVRGVNTLEELEDINADYSKLYS